MPRSIIPFNYVFFLQTIFASNIIHSDLVEILNQKHCTSFFSFKTPHLTTTLVTEQTVLLQNLIPRHLVLCYKQTTPDRRVNTFVTFALTWSLHFSTLSISVSPLLAAFIKTQSTTGLLSSAGSFIQLFAVRSSILTTIYDIALLSRFRW